LKLNRFLRLHIAGSLFDSGRVRNCVNHADP
jgi:hypothetical protein